MVKTVINKLDNVGSEDAFRTFKYEVLFGEDNLNVEVHEQGCIYKFDFDKVYWNTRLHTEHERVCALFKEGEAICDVTAGVGPFAVPAGRKRCFVWANDLNPESYKALKNNVQINKVGQYVRAFNADGVDFIRTASHDLLKDQHSVNVKRKAKASRSNPPKEEPAPVKTLVQPRIFSHYVMNLRASGINFVSSFVGLYSSVPGVPVEEIKKLFEGRRMPLVHVHCFSTKSEDNVKEKEEICQELSRQMGYTITPDMPGVDIYDVRDVAPKKRMFCATFRLPEEVAFRKV